MTRGLKRMLLLTLVTLLTGQGAWTDEPADDYTPPDSFEKGWYARIETSMGRIVARLLPVQAPQSVAHFVALARGEMEWTDPVSGEKLRQPFYDGTRVDYSRAGTTFEVGRLSGTGGVAPLIYVPIEGPGPINFYSGGRLGMGRSPLGRISAVIFFVTVSPQPWLNGEHPCFGEIVQGEEVAHRIAGVKTFSNGRPMEDIRIEAIHIFSVGEPLPLPEPERYHPPQATPTRVR